MLKINSMLKIVNLEFIRFVLVGGFNTVATYLLYLLFLLFCNYTVAYTLTYIIGIFIAYYLNCVFVFKTELKFSKALQFPLVYVVQYLFGVVLLFALVEGLKLDSALAPILVVVLTLPITFIMSKWILKK